MDPVFRNALQTYARRGWAFEFDDRRLVVRQWPTRDMRAVTAAALLLLQANECDEIVLVNVFDIDCMEELIELGWTQSCSQFCLHL
jgi:hypothetical protein